MDVMARDYCMTAGPRGRMILHTLTCPDVHDARVNGRFVGTMLSCEREPDDRVEKHTCLVNADRARSAAG